MIRILCVALIILFGAACNRGPTDKPDGSSSKPPAIAASPHSIALRVRRTIYQDAYIAIPVSEAIVRRGDDGTLHIDQEKMRAEGIRISQDSRVEWQVESTSTELHPIQQATPEGRKTLDTLRQKETRARGIETMNAKTQFARKQRPRSH